MHRKESPVLGLPETVHACLFDLDGVLTDTASVHTKAWKTMFDAYLAQRAARTGEPFVPFDPVGDYLKFVDGRKREDGVRSFLSSRGIELPEGGAADPADAETVHGLGSRKNDAFQKTLHDDGVEVFGGSLRYLEAVTGLDRFIGRRVDGVTLREEHIPGKPAPDSFLRAAELLDVSPAAAVVFEDALSGVAAGRAGNFGFVVGVDRVGHADELRRSGADIVVTDLAELL